jgi:hypothetical protein
MTHYARLGLPVMEDKNAAKNERLEPLPIAERAVMTRAFKEVLIFVMDEISLMNPVMLSHVHQRLCEIRDFDAPMGGIATLLLGDARQLPATGGIDLFTGLVNARLLGTAPLPGTPAAHGLDLFESFTFKELHVNHRCLSGNPHLSVNPHLDVLRHIVNGGLQPIDDRVIDHIPTLTAADLATGEWDDAIYVATEAEVRSAIDQRQSHRYATAHGLPIIGWRNELTTRHRPRFTEDELAEMHATNPSTCGFFVPDAKGYLTKNIHPARRAANGSPVSMHSLLLDRDITEEEAERQTRRIQDAPPGVITWLDRQPHGMAAAVPNASPETWPQSLRLPSPLEDPDKVLIPVLLHKRYATPNDP